MKPIAFIRRMLSIKWLGVCAILAIIFIRYCRSEEDRMILEKKILDRLLDPKRYDKRIRPSGEAGKDSPVVVRVSMYILDISQKDPYLKDFSIVGYFRQTWKDSRLSYAKLSRKTRGIYLDNSQRIWKPDLFIVNEVKASIHELMVPNILTLLFENGKVFYSARLSLLLKCNSNLKFFPHDQQKCRIDIESFGFPASELQLEWDHPPYKNGFSKNLSQGQYKLLDFKSLEPALTDYPELHVELLFSRNFSPYFWRLYLPYIILAVVSCGSFCLSPKCFFQRLSLIAVVLVFMFHLSPDFEQLRQNISDLTALDFWVFGCYTVTFAAFLELILVNHLEKPLREDEVELGDDQLDLNGGEKTESKKDGLSAQLFQRFTVQKRKFFTKYKTTAERIDTICLWIIFPVFFLLLNICYWSVCYYRYCSNLEEWYKIHSA